MFNKVILTYFTPLSSCGNSLTLLKRRNIDCKFLKIASINQVLGGSESVMRYVYCIHYFCHGVGEKMFLGDWSPVSCLNQNARAYFPSL